jgi:hypothetical protein
VDQPAGSRGDTVLGMDPLTLPTLKARWIEVLDDLEATHRTAWLAVFDGRLAALDGDELTLDFSDATKMAGLHSFERATKPQFAEALSDSIERVTGYRVRVRADNGHT